MNVRKPVDYSAMFEALDTLMAADLPQMELYCEIGQLVSGRPEKGAAVAAAEYLCAAYSDASGFSPRNLRRMREFYRFVNSPEGCDRHFIDMDDVVLEASESEIRSFKAEKNHSYYIQAQEEGWSMRAHRRCWLMP